MSDDLLTTARGYLDAARCADFEKNERHMHRAATAHAAVDAAETLRRIEGLLVQPGGYDCEPGEVWLNHATGQRVRIAEGVALTGVHWTRIEPAGVEHDPAPEAPAMEDDPEPHRDVREAVRRTSEMVASWPAHRRRQAQGPADAPATPQVGEVWEDTKDGEMVEVLEGPPYDGAYPCRRIGSPWTDPIYRPVLNGDWRRVSPAPAPLTEREVTAEAEAQGVEPASDEDIARWSEALGAEKRSASWFTPQVSGLIARVRAEQARADEAFGRAEREEANARQAWKREAQFRQEADRAREAEAKAEAQVALMRPVVEAAQEYEATHPRDEREARGCALICPAVRAYREATRDA